MRYLVAAGVFGALIVSGCSEGAPGLFVEFTDSAIHTFSEEERETIAGIAEAAFDDVSELLPDLDSRVDLAVGAGSPVIPETGELGAATAPGRVSWTVDPSRPGGVTEVARYELRATLFHELHHLARGYVMSGGDRPTSFMDLVVAEGLATAFERDAAGRKPLWGEYPDEVEDWVAELLELPVNAPYQEWMFDHPDGRRWIGYRAGTFIADEAIAASGLSAAELVRTPTREVLELARVF